MIVLGGGVLEQEILFNKIKKEVYSQIMESYKGVKIKKAKLGNKAGLYGALARIKKEIKLIRSLSSRQWNYVNVCLYETYRFNR